MVDETPQVSWNSAQYLIQEISTLRTKSNLLCLNKDYAKAFECLRGVKRSIIQNLSKDQRERLKEKEKEFGEALSIRDLLKPTGFSNGMKNNKEIYINGIKQDKDFLMKKVNNLIELYEDYNEMLSDMLESYGYLIPQKEDASKMQF